MTQEEEIAELLGEPIRWRATWKGISTEETLYGITDPWDAKYYFTRCRPVALPLDITVERVDEE